MTKRPPSQRVIRGAARMGKTVEQLTPEEYKRLRGHGQTPEHGGVLGKLPKSQHMAGRVFTSSYSERPAEQAIYRAAGNENRVQIWVSIKGEGWRELGGARGYDARYVNREAAAAGGLRDALYGLPGSGSGDNYDLSDVDPGDIEAFQIQELES